MRAPKGSLSITGGGSPALGRSQGGGAPHRHDTPNPKRPLATVLRPLLCRPRLHPPSNPSVNPPPAPLRGDVHPPSPAVLDRHPTPPQTPASPPPAHRHAVLRVVCAQQPQQAPHVLPDLWGARCAGSGRPGLTNTGQFTNPPGVVGCGAAQLGGWVQLGRTAPAPPADALHPRAHARARAHAHTRRSCWLVLQSPLACLWLRRTLPPPACSTRPCGRRSRRPCTRGTCRACSGQAACRGCLGA